jgi:hypothetical protein
MGEFDCCDEMGCEPLAFNIEAINVTPSTWQSIGRSSPPPSHICPYPHPLPSQPTQRNKHIGLGNPMFQFVLTIRTTIK